jgi:hypothetical protein
MFRRLIVATLLSCIGLTSLPAYAASAGSPSSAVGGSFQVGNDNSVCDSANKGAFRFSSVGNFDTCDGTSWTSLGGGSVTPAGSDQQIQLNNNGVLYASTGLNFSSATGYMGVGISAPLGSLDIVQNSTTVSTADINLFAVNTIGGARRSRLNLYSERTDLTSDMHTDSTANTKGWVIQAVGGGGAGGAQDDLQITSRVPTAAGSHFVAMQIDGTTGNVILGGSAIGANTGAFGAGRFVVNPPTVETIAAGATITVNACGTVKQIDATANRTTDTTNTFTAPAAPPTTSNSGCCMDVMNTDTTDTITLDANANFKTIGGADVVLGPDDAVRVCSNGTVWRQISAVAANQ